MSTFTLKGFQFFIQRMDTCNCFSPTLGSKLWLRYDAGRIFYGLCWFKTRVLTEMRSLECGPHRAPAQQLGSVWSGSRGRAVAENGVVGGRRDAGRLSYQQPDNASAQLGSSVIRGPDRCFLDKNPPEALEEHTGGPVVSTVRHWC